MPVPGHQTMMRPMLEILADGAEHNIRDCYSILADRFHLTETDREEMLPSGSQRLLDNRVGWAKTYLLKAGLLETPRRAVIRITERGRQALASNQQIDNRFLRQFPEFVDFARGGVDEAAPVEPAPGQPIPPPATTAETTPEELIEAGFQQVQKALASDLLDRVKASSPAFFERLVVELVGQDGVWRNTYRCW